MLFLSNLPHRVWTLSNRLIFWSRTFLIFNCIIWIIIACRTSQIGNMFLSRCLPLSISLSTKLSATHHFPIIVLNLDLFETIIWNLASYTWHFILTISPLFLIIQWCIDIVLLILILILLCWIINHNWFIRLIVFANSWIDCGFTYFIIVWSLYLYHILHLIEISCRSTLCFCLFTLLNRLRNVLPVFCG